MTNRWDLPTFDYLQTFKHSILFLGCYVYLLVVGFLGPSCDSLEESPVAGLAAVMVICRVGARCRLVATIF
ncbi:uncharacterized protein LY79DRAFT_538474 [Colletotrichum navitas]|uniref:Uncharacterized protein n=1 Tax=Colletotrichum navitas TaxID=681940 RepID=A0AAD8Q9F2_9PEZI|nr:uncharacterized protein LY79DRAFT_538474 [Colletotrichum navitas]KAK1598195.1 hypothetical protein LY79DRAFT_538474 [Colletotrichum navitas]